jgi:hypothetical protein
MGELRSAYKIFVRKREGKKPLRRPRCRGKGNIRMYLGKTMERSGLYASGSG